MKKLHYFALWCAVALFSHALQAQTNYNRLISLPPQYYDTEPQDLIDLPTHVQECFNCTVYEEGDPNTGVFWQQITSDPLNPSYEGFRQHGYIKQPAQVSHNIQHDIDGNLLFFIVDNYVYDKHGKAIGDFNAFGAHDVRGSQETVIIPDPNNCQRYFVFLSGFAGSSFGLSFYSDQIGNNLEPFYAIINMDSERFESDDFNGIESISEEGFLEFINGLPVGRITDNLPDFPTIPKALNTTYAASALGGDGRLVFISIGERVYVVRIDGNGNIDFNAGNFLVNFDAQGTASSQALRTELELYEFANGTYRIAIYQTKNYKRLLRLLI
jgi:hypothetical protein